MAMSRILTTDRGKCPEHNWKQNAKQQQQQQQPYNRLYQKNINDDIYNAEQLSNYPLKIAIHKLIQSSAQ